MELLQKNNECLAGSALFGVFGIKLMSIQGWVDFTLSLGSVPAMLHEVTGFTLHRLCRDL